MITPLEIENKKFSKQMMNVYSVEEVDDFLDELTIDYSKNYKEVTELRAKVEELNSSLAQYKSIESTLQNTLVMAQTTAEEVKNATENKDIFELAKLIYAIDYKYKTLCVNCGNRYKNTQKCNIFEINRDALDNVNADIIDSKICVNENIICILRKLAFVQNDIIQLCENNQM